MVATADPGPVVTPDSVDYLTTAQNLAAGHGLLAYDGQLLVLFPPGYPAAVAALSWVTSIEPLLAARIIDSLAFGGIVLLGWVLLRRHVELRALRVAGIVAIAVGAPLCVIATAAWSEPLFVLTTLGSIVLLERFLASPGRLGLLAGAAVLAAAAFYVRHVGVAMVATGAAVLLFAPAAPLGQRLRWSLGFAGVSGTLVAAWIVRNLVETSSPVGDRLEGSLPLGTALDDALTVVAAWFLPNAVPDAIRIAALLTATGALLFAAVRFMASERRRSLAPLALFTGIFVLLMIASAAGTELDRLDDRLLSPAYVPGLVLALAVLDDLLGRFADRRAVFAFGAVVAVAVAFTAIAGIKTLREIARDGGTYTSQRWQASPVLGVLRANPPSVPVFSNRARPVSFATEVGASCWPGESEPVCKGSSNEPIDVAAAVGASGAGVIAWVMPPAANPEPSAPDGFSIRPLAAAADGGLYCVTSLRESASC